MAIGCIPYTHDMEGGTGQAKAVVHPRYDTTKTITREFCNSYLAPKMWVTQTSTQQRHGMKIWPMGSFILLADAWLHDEQQGKTYDGRMTGSQHQSPSVAIPMASDKVLRSTTKRRASCLRRPHRDHTKNEPLFVRSVTRFVTYLWMRKKPEGTGTPAITPTQL